MRRRRVVVTGLGVVAPNGHGLAAFARALHQGRSGLSRQEQLAPLNFACQVAGVPADVDGLRERYFAPDDRLAMNSAMTFANVAALDAWRDAGLPPPGEHRDPDTGAIIGSGLGGADTVGEKIVPMTNAGKVRRMGSTMIEQAMASCVSAKTAGLLALGNQVTTNSSACTTGAEAVVMAAERIGAGLAERMLAGGAESTSHFVWAGFDAMRVLNRAHNDQPERASRPLSASAGGFIPAAGAGVLLLESLESAEGRGARIYAEVLGGVINCGGHRDGGSMTAPNAGAVQDCIRTAVRDAGIVPGDIDAINGHLTGTFADPLEVKNWSRALELAPERMPLVNATKSMIGHGLGAAGSMELVGVVLQLHHGFVHGSINCEDLHPELAAFEARIPRVSVEPERLDIFAKASFGFGDVNACVVLRRWPATERVALPKESQDG